MAHPMSALRTFRASLIVHLVLLAALGGCNDDLPSARLGPFQTVRPDSGGTTPTTPDTGVEPPFQPNAPDCAPPVASEKIPAREAVMTLADGGGENRGMFTSDLYNLFVDHCGSCHAREASQGGFNVSRASFGQRITPTVLSLIRSNDPERVMPPGRPFNQRAETDPVVRFSQLLDAWIAAGKPDDVFYPEGSSGGGDPSPGENPYQFTRSLGMSLTNVGNCIPHPRIVGGAESTAVALDEKFAAMERFEDFPKTLDETDLFTFDSAELAKMRVFAFAPAYTLWADYAKKLRHVRVPQGESIRFDAARQHFTIPPNTRFYKTFVKQVKDLDGNVRYRKMETRLIVARPDRVEADGSFEPTALFATYKWNDEETEARLHEIRYKDGDGFTDDLHTYVVDEQLEDQIVRTGPAKLDEKLLEAGARRHYAIPGSDRCVNCHMGSPDHSFVLGFTPLQIHRRPLGTSGVLEPAEAHELDQLQRFIEYGLVTGIASASEVLPLEDSQGSRKPRNEHELNAQGYMLGNCAHCHNPVGLPSVREKVLADVLDFLPSETGGIFEFPLDRMSPRTFRGKNQDIQVPYITPSLFDHPRAVLANADPALAYKVVEKLNYTPAELREVEVARELLANGYPTPREPSGAPNISDPYLQSHPVGRPLHAPWRSMIYRNVDAPFSYQDGVTIFPRMPMDTPGYDCRARQLLGSWMVSIPAKREPNRPLWDPLRLYDLFATYEEAADVRDQPWVEVRPGDSGFDDAKAAAEARLLLFRNGERYDDCPTPDLDIVAPEVASGSVVVPYEQETRLTSASGNAEVYRLLSPARPHYPKTDLRELPTWSVRRPDWFEILVERGVDERKESAGGAAAQNSRAVIATVRGLPLTPEFREFALRELPMGLWQEKPGCETKLEAQPKARDFTGDRRPDWFRFANPPATAPVYSASPGAMVFDMVCSKCHGPNGDGRSALANTIADLTGGLSKVADLRNGIFGPAGSPESNWSTEFGRASGMLGGNAEAWAARYLVWMGLGGTNATIPPTVISLVGNASVLGKTRAQNLADVIGSDAAANMLATAKEACAKLLTWNGGFDPRTGRPRRIRAGGPETGLENVGRSLLSDGFIVDRGEAALWEELCFFDNPAPVRVAAFVGNNSPVIELRPLYDVNSRVYGGLFRRSQYPASTPIGDMYGRVAPELRPGNLAPWCMDVPESRVAEWSALQTTLQITIPRCPVGLQGDVTGDEVNAWATRGAANAGVAVFHYLNALAKGDVRVKPAFSRCEDL